MCGQTDPDIAASAERLEAMVRRGYFAVPRSVAEIWCHLRGDQRELAIVGLALHRIWRLGMLSRTVLADGLLRYEEPAAAATWPSIDLPRRLEDRVA